MSYLLYFLGFLPSIIWLLFYLQKDAHPESNKMVLKIFFLGMFSAFLAIFVEKGFQFAVSFLKTKQIISFILAVFVGGAFVEEYLKYLIVKIWAFKDSELDEPFDVILYMIISALGFASLENILVLTNYHPILTASRALEVMVWRFISATFLHALCSALIGYFAVLGFYRVKRKRFFIGIGLIISTILHGLYNWSIMKVEGIEKFILPAIILIGLYFLISFVSKKVKKLKGLCLISNS